MTVSTTPAHDEKVRSGLRAQRDRALRDSILSGIAGKAITAMLSLASVAVSVRAVGETRFGVLATLATLTGLMAFADLGLGSGLMTFLADAVGRDDDSRAREMVSTAAFGMLALGAAVATTGVVAAWLLPWNAVLGAPHLDESSLRTAVATFFVATGLAVPAGLGQRVQVGHQRGLAANGWALASAVVAFTGTATAAAVDAPLWCYVFAVSGIPVAVAGGQTIWTLRRSFPHLAPRIALVSRGSVRQLGGVSMLFLGLNVAVAIAYQSDAVIVSSGLGAGAAAVFAVALRMFSLLTTTIGQASQQMWTSMAEALARGDHDWVRSRLGHILVATTCTAGPVAALLVVAGRPIARLWVGPELVPPLGLLVAFAVWTVYFLLLTQISLFLNAARVVGPQLVSAVAMTVTNVALSICLTRRIGLSGPVVGSLVAHLVCTGIPSVIWTVRALNHHPEGLAMTNRAQAR